MDWKVTMGKDWRHGEKGFATGSGRDRQERNNTTPRHDARDSGKRRTEDHIMKGTTKW